MSIASPYRACLTVLAAVFLLPGTARAGFVEDAAFGLGYFGFNIQGQRNPLNGGIDLIVNRNFVGNPLDFGNTDLTIQGPLSFQLSTSNRGIGELELAFTTALDAASPATSLFYTLNSDVGGQATEVSGSLLLDSSLKINRFGFYDLNFNVSSRQDVTQDGRFADGDAENDFDIGPVNLSGNIIADLIALITDPLFDQAGVSNPFARFSGASSLSAVLTDTATGTLDALAKGDDPVSKDRVKVIATSKGAMLVDPYPFALTAKGTTTSFLIPEPGVLMLLAAGIPAIIGRRPRRNR